tara:strand:- start:1721 stop:2863 length:1143 start_codon:yes stop_codon:yes gene_type:complete
MKKILFRKLFVDYMSFFLIALFSTSIVVWVFQAVNFLDIMIEDGRDYLTYINYSLLNFPKILSKLFPFVLFFSLFYVTTKIELNNELIILWNFGINKIRIVNFFLIISIFLLLIQIILNSLIVPKSQDLARSFLRTSTVNFYGNFIKAQKFNDTIKGLTIFSEKKSDDGKLYNIYIKKNLDNNNFQITYSKSGSFKNVNNSTVMVLNDGQTITGNENELTNLSFSKSDFSLRDIETNTTTFIKTQETSSEELLKCIYYLNFHKKNIPSIEIKKINNCSIKNLSNIYKEIYKRFVIPFYIPILSLIPLLLILSSKENINYFKLRITTFLIGLLTIIFSETTIRIISKVLINNISITIIPLIYFFIIYFVFLYNFKFKNKII